MNKALAATELLIALLNQAAQISAILRLAQAADREITDEEWSEILGVNDQARQRLDNAIKAARAQQD